MNTETNEQAKLQRTPEQLAASIAELTKQLAELKARKKAFNSQINAEIRDIETIMTLEADQWERLRTQM